LRLCDGLRARRQRLAGMRLPHRLLRKARRGTGAIASG
jgi:hypothetical protein